MNTNYGFIWCETLWLLDLLHFHYCEDWKTNGNDTSTDPPDGAGKRQRATKD